MKLLREVTVCEWVAVEPIPPQADTKVRVAMSTLGGNPINGMRLPVKEDKNGWHFWCGGKPSQESSFFTLLPVEHLSECLPQVLEYLSLPPGYCFLIDETNYEDVWFDQLLLESNE
jgi:hypothetical protein